MVGGGLELLIFFFYFLRLGYDHIPTHLVDTVLETNPGIYVCYLTTLPTES